MNKEELRQLILTLPDGEEIFGELIEDPYNAEPPFDEWDNKIAILFYENGIKFDVVEQHGGEGMGDEYWAVFSITKDGVTTNFKVDGWYASHHGHEWHNVLHFYEVNQVEVMVKRWKAV